MGLRRVLEESEEWYMFSGRDGRSGRDAIDEKNRLERDRLNEEQWKTSRANQVRGDGLDSGMGRTGDIKWYEWLGVIGFWIVLFGLNVLFG